MPISPPDHARLMFDGQFLHLYQWEQPMFDGSQATFECVTRTDGASVIPFLDRDTIVLTKQWRPQDPDMFMDVPGGRADGDEDLATAAGRELTEETGYRAAHLLEWRRFAHKGFVRYEQGLFLAAGLEDGIGTHTDAGEKIETMIVSWNELVRLSLENKLREPRVMLAVLQMEFDPDCRRKKEEWLDSVFLHKS